MYRVTIGLVVSALLHGVLLQVAMGEPQQKYRMNVNPGKMSMAIKKRVKQPEEQEEQKKEKPKPDPDPTKKKKPDKKKEKKTEKKEKTKKKKKETKPTPASKKRRGAEWVKKADYRSNPSPDYPERSRRLGHEGTVILKVLVDKDGEAETVTVRRSSGHDALDDSAVKTVRDWEFTPASTAGVPVKSTVLVPIKFRLNE